MWSRAGRTLRQTRRVGLLTRQLGVYLRPTQQAWLVTGPNTVLPMTTSGVTQMMHAVPYSSIASNEAGVMGEDATSTDPSSTPSQASIEDAEAQEDEIQSTRMKTTVQKSAREDILAKIHDGDMSSAISLIEAQVVDGKIISAMFARNCGRSAQDVAQLDEFVSRVADWGLDKDSFVLAPTLMTRYFGLGDTEKGEEFFSKRPSTKEYPRESELFLRGRAMIFAGEDKSEEGDAFIEEHYPKEEQYRARRNFFDSLTEKGFVDSAVKYHNDVSEKHNYRFNPTFSTKMFIQRGKCEAVRHCLDVADKLGWVINITAPQATEIITRMLNGDRVNLVRAIDAVKAAHEAGCHVSLSPFVDFSLATLREDKVPGFHFLLHRIEELGCTPAAWRHLFNKIFKGIDQGTVQHVGMLWKHLESRASPNHMTKIILTSKESRLRFLHHTDIPYNLLSFLGANVSNDWATQSVGYQQGGDMGYGAPQQQYGGDYGAPQQPQYDQHSQYAPQQQTQYPPQHQPQYPPQQQSQYPPQQQSQYPPPQQQFGTYDQAPPASHQPQGGDNGGYDQGGYDQGGNYERW